MIRTAIQLKAKVRNLSGGDRKKAQTLIRNFIMERFLERITRSQYRNNFILKGGMLVAAIVGLDTRATMDIDTTVKSLNLTKDNAVNIVEDIIAIDLSDGVQFQITKVTDIMEERDYPGIRFMLETTMDKMRQAIKIDISTGDIITPGAVEYAYNLMFEDRAIFLWTYNMETLLDLADHWLMLVRVELEVFADNEQAIRLYEKLGFREVGRRKNYYRAEHEDALLMTVEFDRHG